MFDAGKCIAKSVDAFTNRARGIDVQGSTKLVGELRQRNLLALQNRFSRISGTVGESGRALEGVVHALVVGSPFTLIATTVWSSKVSTPEACSAAALKMDFTIESADSVEHCEMTFSRRVRPKSSPARFVASRILSLKNTNTSSGSA